MYYPPPKFLSIMQDRTSFKTPGTSIPSNLDAEQFNEEMRKFKKNYPDVDKYNKEYTRPTFLFPALNSPDGNPLCYFTLAINALKEAKFFQEATELQQLVFTDNREHFKHITNYLDIGNFLTFEEYSEQVSFAKKRNLSLSITPITYVYHEPQPVQVPQFISPTLIKIKKLIDNNFDFNTTNTFGRNMLWYVDTPDITSYLINNTDINIFQIDETEKNVFQKCFLHQDVECSYGTFFTIVENMKQQNSNMAHLYLEHSGVFESIIDTFTSNLIKEINSVSPIDYEKNSKQYHFSEIPKLCSILKDFNVSLLETLADQVGQIQSNIISNKSSVNIAKLPFITEIYETILNNYIPENKKTTKKSLKF